MTNDDTWPSGVRVSAELLSSLRRRAEVELAEESFGVHVKLHSGALVWLSRTAGSKQGDAAWVARLYLTDPQGEPDAVTRSEDLSVESVISTVSALIRLDNARLIARQGSESTLQNGEIDQSTI